MNLPAQHTTIEKRPAGGQNGIIRPFVASKKKYLFLKRGFDIACSSLVILLVLSWLVPLLALVIKADSRGPVFFRQKRIGRHGRLFMCWKFRTMVQNGEADERPAEKNDERITRLGRILRSANIDELPQFFNVLAGQMSIVGPRPHMAADCIRFSFIISCYSFRHNIRPGITGWAQVNGYHGPAMEYETVMLRYYWDAMYVRKATMWLDLKIIFKTILQGFTNLAYQFKNRVAVKNKRIAEELS